MKGRRRRENADSGGAAARGAAQHRPAACSAFSAQRPEPTAWEQAQKKTGSIGIAIPGGKICLENDKGKNIDKSFETGELTYYGDNVTLGYAENRSDLIKGDENHGVLHTGDLAQRDNDGFYYIVGRKNRYLKMFGNRINLDEIEQLILSEEIECACSGVDDSLIIFFTKLCLTTSFSSKYINEMPSIFFSTSTASTKPELSLFGKSI